MLKLFKQLMIMPYYAVAKGRKVGIFNTWAECEIQVKNFSFPKYRKFNTKNEAEEFITLNGGKLSDNTDPILIEPKELKSGKRSASDSQNNNVTKKIKSNQIFPTKLTKFGDYMFLEDDDNYVQVFTDGSCENNGKTNASAGLGVYFGEDHELNTAKAVSGRATNNCGEIQAASLAIKLACDCGIKKLCINTDSQFLINSITKWLPAWKRRNWKLMDGSAIKNIIDFQELDNILKNDINVKWNYVKAHCGILGNERADELAKQGTALYRKQRNNKD